jgi:hypothetical protein
MSGIRFQVSEARVIQSTAPNQNSFVILSDDPERSEGEESKDLRIRMRDS